MLDDLTAVIATKDRNENLALCLGSLLQATFVPFVIVVDFGSATPVTEVFPEFPNTVRVIRVERKTEMFHKARALNIGIREVKTPYTCITDADQVFAANFFAVIRNRLRKYENSFIQCYTYFLERFPEIVITSDNIKRYYNYLVKVAKAQGRRLKGYGCCHGVATKWLHKVHGYDEKNYFGWGAEDRDLELRAKYDGLKLRWAHTWTSMIHLPHPKTGKYYSEKLVDKNLDTYYKLRDAKDTKEKLRRIVANRQSWGKL